MGERVEGVLAHLWVLGVEVGVAGNGLLAVRGGARVLVVDSEGAPVGLGIGSRVPEHY